MRHRYFYIYLKNDLPRKSYEGGISGTAPTHHRKSSKQRFRTSEGVNCVGIYRGNTAYVPIKKTHPVMFQHGHLSKTKKSKMNIGTIKKPTPAAHTPMIPEDENYSTLVPEGRVIAQTAS